MAPGYVNLKKIRIHMFFFLTIYLETKHMNNIWSQFNQEISSKSSLEQELAGLHLSKPRPNAHIITKSKLDAQK